jgi:DME family drug/metabolite transporter
MNQPEPSIARRWPSGVLFCLAAAVLWSTSGFFAGVPEFAIWPIEQRGSALAFWRACFALVLLLPLVRRVSWHWRMLPMMACFAAMNWTYLTALVGGPPANAIWLQNLAPAWVMLFSLLVYREPVEQRDWWMLGLCIGGVLFIVAMQLLLAPPSERNFWWAPWLAILSGILYAGVILSLRQLRAHDSAWLIALNHLATAATMLPLLLWNGSALPAGRMWWWLAGLGMLQMGMPYWLFARGLRTTPGHIASLITLLEPLLLPIWIHLAWSSSPNYAPPPWWTWVGGGLILAGLVLRFGRRTSSCSQGASNLNVDSIDS